MPITAHCIVKNEENFVHYTIASVIEYVDRIIIFDTGSTDRTIERIQKLAARYPDKIIFEEKGPCSKVEHTKFRQEMLDRTASDWFMILDGDEIWTKRGMQEVKDLITENEKVNCVIAPYYLCVGDIFHHSIRGKYHYGTVTIHALPRFFRRVPGVRWHLGPYGQGDYVEDNQGDLIRPGNYVIMAEKYWHVSALERSSKDHEVSMGRHKQVMTYSLKLLGEGFKIKNTVPEVFTETNNLKLSPGKSLVNAVLLVLYGLKILKKRLWI
ncbi:MAG: hypothetical protein A3I29_04135 [Candidatus Magasanikbacteria bacterium RIFCSPLOWO2_02_FULL_44_11]|uniref:Glycosyltransferase 2-like domain-containing protein n=2 Tax=Candidatus Magasanikiibacteriota TaxID=1752731 RepID=A0A1F6N9K3_9BACT|nr:MAG: hypothetical protein A3D53_02855 [Candidatus Magasanikbacteria bacterium RIFCSPHIGHO2_02_FULL_45_10]OGH80602.1 MAG: hypothetical protein A3I29_04135 [Candidatus Magasanikbacteria bacterium RIFCSPLOWO2_02_FULL_44_11]